MIFVSNAYFSFSPKNTLSNVLITENEIIGFSNLVEVVAIDEWNIFEYSHYSMH